MNFSKLPKEKRNHLILVFIVTLAVLAALGFGLIRNQKAGLERADAEQGKLKLKLEDMNAAIRKKDQVQQVLGEASRQLGEQEKGMARGDLYAWFIDVVSRYKSGYKLDIPQLSPATPQTPCNLIPRFPYKQSSVTIAGSGYYHDIGRFVCDFENDYPYVRVLNLTLEPNPVVVAGEREKLSFRMDLVALVKPK